MSEKFESLKPGESYIMLEDAIHEDWKSNLEGVKKGDKIVFLKHIENLYGQFIEIKVENDNRVIDIYVGAKMQACNKD